MNYLKPLLLKDAPFLPDYESYAGRKEYAHTTAGGYYTVRLAVLEKLKRTETPSRSACVAFIDPSEYVAPLGVWVTREAAKNAMQSKPLSWQPGINVNLCETFCQKEISFSVDTLLRRSILLRNKNVQEETVGV